ncbi:MAG: M48 family metalloprotease [Sulfuritalea sp.]|nr:M48 family metalloprotease [Sulfuritalea sp.]MDP1981743.1 M48 family metalloprotease [Sulfuritalea sp.]
MSRAVLSVFLLFFVTACATSPEGRKQVVAPTALQGFSAVYSEFDLYLQLVTAADAPLCKEAECAANRAFDQRILVLGKRLADAAFRQHADLQLRFPRFDFVVADKRDPGAASSAAGTVVIYRGVRQLNLDDAALAFILAREMNHIIAGHHDENVTTSILVAVAAQILLPVLNIGALFSSGAASTAAATTAASSVAASTAVASVASFAGARALRASDRPLQVREAEVMAMKLLAAAGWEGREVSDQLEALRHALPDEPDWTVELRDSTRRIASLMQGPVRPEGPTTVGALSQIEPRLSYDLPPPMVSKPF